MQIEMHDVESQFGRFNDPQQSIHIGAIAVYQSTSLMHDADYFDDVFIKQSEGIGIGNHNSGQLFVAFGCEIIQIDIAAFIGTDRKAFKSAHDGRSRIGPVRAIRD